MQIRSQALPVCLSFQVADGVSVPASVAIPFGAFERTLQDPSNAACADAIQGLQKDLVGIRF